VSAPLSMEATMDALSVADSNMTNVVSSQAPPHLASVGSEEAVQSPVAVSPKPPRLLKMLRASHLQTASSGGLGIAPASEASVPPSPVTSVEGSVVSRARTHMASAAVELMTVKRVR
jgi:hypothetical protein